MNRKVRHRARFNAETVGRKDARSQITDKRCHADRRKRSDRVATDNQFETVKGAAERRPEGASNRSRRAAADQDAHIISA